MNCTKGLGIATLAVALTLGNIASAQILTSDGIQGVGSCRVIDKPGSYALTKNIIAKATDLKAVPGGVPACILIIADFVTLDLRGHTLTGPGSGFGIYSTGNSSGRAPSATHVRNGSVTNFDRGIALEGDGHAAEQVRLLGNLGAGLTFDGVGSRAEAVHTLNNGNGILCFGGFGHSVQHSHASQNGTGINLGACPGSSIVANNVSGNGGDGIVAKCPSVIVQNMAFQNAGSDILTDLPVPACTRADNNPAP
jgi:hypothetical protein